MTKKIILACMAIAAFAAFVLPATASASPEIGETSGGVLTPLAVGSKITGTQTETWRLVSSVATVSCSSVTMTGTLNKNKGTHIEETIETATFAGTGALGKCTSTIGDVTVITNVGSGVPWCLTAGGELGPNEFTVRGDRCANTSRSITFVLAFAQQVCYYDRSAAVAGTYTTDTNGSDAVLTVENAVWKLEKSEHTDLTHPCLGDGTLKGAATLETEGTPIVPLYIK